VTGVPLLQLLVGGAAVNATYDRANSTSTVLRFNYAIAANQADANGISVLANGLTLPGVAGTTTIKDGAGNNAVLTHAAVSDNSNYKVDTTVAAPLITSLGGLDRIVSTQSGDNRVSGTAEAGSTVTVLTGSTVLGTATANTLGAWTYDLSSANLTTLGQGTNKSITARAVDLAGNQSTNASAYTFAVFTVNPDAPVISAVGGSDRVVSGLLNDNLVTGTALAGTTITVSSGSTTLGTTTTGSNGAWTYTLTPANLTTLGQGADSITAVARDPVGNTSVASTAFTFTVDTAGAAVSSIALTSATGALNGFLNVGDMVTASVTMNEAVTVTGVPLLQLLVGGAAVNATYDRANSTSTVLRFNYAIAANQADANGISVLANGLTLPGVAGTTTIKDGAGNNAVLTHAAVSDNSNYKVDTTVAAPLITSLGGLDRIVSTQSGDNRVSGTAEAGSTVTVLTGSTVLGTATANTLGAWTYDLSSANLTTLGQGTNKSITARAVDLAGNQSTNASAYTFAVFTVNPDAPVISAVGGSDRVVSGLLNDNLVTGTALAGTTITVSSGSTTLGTTTTGSNGAWTYTLTPANLTTLGQGADSITAVARDPVGNTSVASTAFTFTVDTAGAAVSSIALTSATGALNGFLNVGDMVTASVTMNEAVTVTGVPLLQLLVGGAAVNATYDRANSTSTVLRFNYAIAANQADANGISVLANGLTLPGVAGTTTIKDGAGNNAVLTHAAVSDNSNYKVDTTVAAPLITSLGGLDRIVSTQSGDNRVSGTAEAGSTVTVLTGSTVLGTATANTLGAWTYDLSSANLTTLGQGTNKSITARAVDLAGNQSTNASAYTFAVFTVNPDAPVISAVGGSDRVVSGLLNDNLVTGTALAGTTITVSSGSTTLGTTTTGSNGAWTYTLTPANLTTLGQGADSITAVARDPVGNTSVASTAFTFTVDTAGAAVSSIALTSATGALNGFLNVGDMVTAKRHHERSSHGDRSTATPVAGGRRCSQCHL
jgi:large repetitive protein